MLRGLMDQLSFTPQKSCFLLAFEMNTDFVNAKYIGLKKLYQIVGVMQRSAFHYPTLS